MRTWIFLSMCLLGGSIRAFAASPDCIPLIKGDDEKFCMVDLNQQQCSMEILDTENGYSPIVNFDLVRVYWALDFRGGVYLSSSAHDGSDLGKRNRHTYAVIKVYRGERDRQLITVNAKLTEDRLSTGNYVIKDSRFNVLIDRKTQATEFEERLSYQVWDRETHNPVFLPGKIRNDLEVRRANQAIQVNGDTVFFQRKTETGILFLVNCRI